MLEKDFIKKPETGNSSRFLQKIYNLMKADIFFSHVNPLPRQGKTMFYSHLLSLYQNQVYIRHSNSAKSI